MQADPAVGGSVLCGKCLFEGLQRFRYMYIAIIDNEYLMSSLCYRSLG